jgi:hypothetical protein
MSFNISITADKTDIKLGETFTVTYNCAGAYYTTIQGDNMPTALSLEPGNVSGTMKFLPVTDGLFSVCLTAFGVVHQSKPGADNNADVETNVAQVSVTVS